jgi:hypothetical protein
VASLIDVAFVRGAPQNTIYAADQTHIYPATRMVLLLPLDPRRSSCIALRISVRLRKQTKVLVQQHMLAATGAFGLKRVLERELETCDGRSALTQSPSGEGRTRVLWYGLHLGK